MRVHIYQPSYKIHNKKKKKKKVNNNYIHMKMKTPPERPFHMHPGRHLQLLGLDREKDIDKKMNAKKKKKKGMKPTSHSIQRLKGK